MPNLFWPYFWSLKLINTLSTYFNDKIKPKPSTDGTLSSNTILFSDGRYCTDPIKLEKNNWDLETCKKSWKIFEFDFTLQFDTIVGTLPLVVALADYGTFSPYCSNQASK